MGVLLLNRPKYGDYDDITQMRDVSTYPRKEYQRAAWWYTNGMYYTWAGLESEGLSQGAMTWLAPNYAKR